MKVSIITVCFNSVATIERTLQSVLTQSYSNYEYIVIDGASTDGTIDVLKRWEKRFAGKMRWISEKDNGIYDAMNKGIALATGDLVSIINSDDFLEVEALASIAKVARCYGADVYYGIERQLNANGSEHRLIRYPHTGLPMQTIWHQSSCISRMAYHKYGLYDTRFRFGADYELFLRYYLAGARFQPVDHIIANFSLTGTSSHNVTTTLIEALNIRRYHGTISTTGYWLRRLRLPLKKLLKL